MLFAFEVSHTEKVTEVPGTTLFGRLVYLSSLRDGGNTIPQDREKEHLQEFRAWVGLSLESQCAEVEEFLAKLGGLDRAERWIEAFQSQDLIPPATPRMERELFRSDLEVVFELWRSNHTDRRQPADFRVKATSWFQRFLPKGLSYCTEPGSFR